VRGWTSDLRSFHTRRDILSLCSILSDHWQVLLGESRFGWGRPGCFGTAHARQKANTAANTASAKSYGGAQSHESIADKGGQCASLGATVLSLCKGNSRRVCRRKSDTGRNRRRWEAQIFSPDYQREHATRIPYGRWGITQGLERAVDRPGLRIRRMASSMTTTFKSSSCDLE
jgi:hypothetical protein